MNWEGYAWILWYALFFVFEAIGLWKRHQNEGMTLTYFTEQHVPKWILAMLLGWMWFHFLIDSPARG